MNPKSSRGVLYNKFQLESETLQWLNAITNPAQPVGISAINQFIRQCKMDGNWQLLDCFWLFAQGDQTNARRCIKNPTATVCTEVNSPSWTAYQGYTGNGSTSYINTNFNETTSGVNFTQNSGSLIVYCMTNSAAATILEIGHSDATNKTFLALRDTGNFVDAPINMSVGVGTPQVSNSNSQGMFQMSRTASNLTTIYRNGASLGTTATASNGLVNNNIYVCADNLNGVASLFSNRQISMAAIGGGGIDALKFYNAFQTLATQLGFNV